MTPPVTSLLRPRALSLSGFLGDVFSYRQAATTGNDVAQPALLHHLVDTLHGYFHGVRRFLNTGEFSHNDAMGIVLRHVFGKPLRDTLF